MSDVSKRTHREQRKFHSTRVFHFPRTKMPDLTPTAGPPLGAESWPPRVTRGYGLAVRTGSDRRQIHWRGPQAATKNPPRRTGAGAPSRSPILSSTLSRCSRNRQQATGLSAFQSNGRRIHPSVRYRKWSDMPVWPEAENPTKKIGRPELGLAFRSIRIRCSCRAVAKAVLVAQPFAWDRAACRREQGIQPLRYLKFWECRNPPSPGH